VPMEHVF
jgi:hypothetical protein